MLETACRCQLSKPAATLLSASSAVVLSLWPPRNGDPVQAPVYVYVLEDKFVFKVCFLNRACVSGKKKCVLKDKCVCIFVCVRVKNVFIYWKVCVCVFVFVCVLKKICVRAFCGSRNLSVQYLPRQLWSPRGQTEQPRPWDQWALPHTVWSPADTLPCTYPLTCPGELQPTTHPLAYTSPYRMVFSNSCLDLIIKRPVRSLLPSALISCPLVVCNQHIRIVQMMTMTWTKSECIFTVFVLRL